MPETQDDQCRCKIIHGERVEAARKSAIESNELHNAVDLLKAMADTSRFKIIHALKEDEMCVCDLAALLGVSQSAVSHQLRLLRNLRLVSNRRQGPILYYRLNDTHVEQLMNIALEHIRE
ncbi:MAG: metalloregulator ArsR/SmtB family transcription factor [Proteobacteria bacterium]|nr:metalloregulator ArsR/SmtB family transcription factor [Pseudomonadota bacterium]MBU1711008.1 metalloregulator ArsR/SmtB family transcription factor [Pseudomonadota bacterium]